VLDNIDKIVFDEHTTPQTSFLKFIGRTRYVDIHDQKWVTNLLSETSRRSNNKLNNSVVMINTTSHNVDKNDIKKSIDDVYSTQLLNRLKEYYSAEDMVGKSVVFVANLKPRKLRGVMSEGMMLAADDGNGSVRLITLDGDITPGSQVR